MARRKKPAEHVNHERWLVSYADFITLLFATFTMLFAISNADKEKWAKAAKSLTTAFEEGPSAVMAPHVAVEADANPNGSVIFTIFPNPGAGPKAGKGAGGDGTELESPLDGFAIFKKNGPEGEPESKRTADGRAASVKPTPPPLPTPAPTPTPPGGSSLGQSEGQGNEALAAEIKELLDTAGLQGKVEVRQEKRGMVISLGEAAFFPPGEADVLPQSHYQLDKIINALRNRSFQIRIEGHTDDTPVTSGKFRSNSELSAMRATRIMDFMIQQYHFPPENLSAAGYGEWRPIADNSTPDGKQKNRRVDIVILNDAAKSREPG
ncbi:MAG: OmpA family protein [bacterium]|nr:OmpA family protein [bacterium]